MKSEMPPYSALDLKKNDLVLLECNIMHYHVKDSENRWSSQCVQMEMLAISLLFSAEPASVECQSAATQDILGLRI